MSVTVQCNFFFVTVEICLTSMLYEEAGTEFNMPAGSKLSSLIQAA